MKILVVGSGGREHALVRKIKESPLCTELFCCPGNAGIKNDATLVDIKATDIDGVVEFSVQEAIDLVVVAPDDPLVLGMVDALEAKGIKTFGPNKAAAIIEGSKVFAKNLMHKYNIPTAAFGTFEDTEKAMEFIRSVGSYPVVIKADGLALGKGVIIAENEEEAMQAVRSMIEDGRFGQSGRTVVIEEFLTGIEVSLLCFTDGETIRPMATSMDHKRVFEGDKGPNTGGMGTIAPHPMYTADVAKMTEERILYPTIRAMKAEGRNFKGCLYFGLILTAKGPYVIEYNCRFGDPETQVVLPLLDGDIVEIMLAIHNGSLDRANFSIKDAVAACLIVASGGYPGSYEKGYPINGLDKNGQHKGVTIYHAGTAFKNGHYTNNGGRVLGITSVAPSLSEALRISYEAAAEVHFEHSFFRKDIGAKVL